MIMRRYIVSGTTSDGLPHLHEFSGPPYAIFDMMTQQWVKFGIRWRLYASLVAVVMEWGRR